MFGGNRGDRGALAALTIVVVGAVLAAWLGNPTYQIECGNAQANECTDNAQGKAVEAVYWGIFTTRDTLAQWIAGAAAVLSFVASVWAILIVRETLQETRKATKAAFDANATAREMGEAQVRAYVNLVDVEIKSYDEMRTAAIAMYGGDIPNEVVLIFKNSGQSPAINTKVRFRRKSVGKLILETFDQNLDGIEYSPPGVFPAGHHFSRDASTILTSDEYNDIIAGDIHDVIFGEIIYEDVFGKKMPPVFFRVLGRDLNTERRRFSPF